jgi:hypothetical protein
MSFQQLFENSVYLTADVVGPFPEMGGVGESVYTSTPYY